MPPSFMSCKLTAQSRLICFATQNTHAYLLSRDANPRSLKKGDVQNDREGVKSETNQEKVKL